MKKLLVVSVCLMVALSFAFAGGEKEKAAGKGKLIIYVTPLLSMSPDWAYTGEMFKKAGKDLGFEARWVGPNEIKVEEMVADIETAIAEKAGGIITCPLNAEAFNGVLKRAMDAGIPVVVAAADCDRASRLAFIGTDYVNLGKAFAEKLAQKTNGKANVGVIMTDASAPNQVAELKAFQDAILDKPGMKVIDVQYDQSQQSVAIEKASAMLTAHPEMDAIVCLEGWAPSGAAKAVEEKGKAGKVLILGIDLMPQTLEYVKKGVIWGAFTQGFDQWGYGAAKIIVDYWAGKKPASDVIDSGFGFWTIENVDTYRK